MKKELFIELIKKGKKISSMYTLPQIVAASLGELDVRGVAHRGYFASVTDFNSYYNANISLIDIKTAEGLFNPWTGRFIPKPTTPARHSIWRVQMSKILLFPTAA